MNNDLIFTTFYKVIANDVEKLDTTPVEVPFDCKAPQTTKEILQELLYNKEFKERLNAIGEETFEDADDFSVDGDDWENDGLGYEQEFDFDLPVENGTFSPAPKDGPEAEGGHSNPPKEHLSADEGDGPKADVHT